MLLSIITCTYNCFEPIKETLASIQSFNKTEIEHIIIDGSSTDKTLEVLHNYEKKSKYPVVIISEKDQGIYDAMNKGIKKASGNFIFFLLAGDTLSIPVDNLLEELKQNIDSDIVAFSGFFKKYNSADEFWNRLNYQLSPYNPAIRFPCLIIKNSIYQELNYFDLKYKVSSDFDLISRYLNSKNKVKISEKPLLIMEPFGFSNNPKSFYLKKKEHRRIVSRNSLSLDKFNFYVRNLKHLILYTIRTLLKS